MLWTGHPAGVAQLDDPLGGLPRRDGRFERRLLRELEAEPRMPNTRGVSPFNDFEIQIRHVF